jgi:predicted PurR-regulated permease PerM
MVDQPLTPDRPSRPELSSALFAMLATLVGVVIVAVLYFAREVVIPIVLAVLLSFLLAPAVRRLQRLRVGRVASVTFIVLIAFLAMLGFGGVVIQEISSLAQELPSYRSNLETKIRSLPDLVPGGGVFHRATEMLRELRRELMRSETQPAGSENRPGTDGAGAVEPTGPLPVQIQQPDLEPLQIVQSIIEPLIRPLATSGLVMLLVILILLDREDLRDKLLRLAGRRDLQRTTEAMDDAAGRISRYLRSQLIVNACCAVPIGLGLTVIGIPNAALWSIMTLVLRFVPYLGIIIAASFPLALAIAVAPGWGLLIWTILLFVVVELVISYVVEPFVYGDSAGVSPVALIAAATFWTWLWGPIGLLLSTPMTVCLVVLGRHVPQLQFLDVVLSNRPALTSEETFYQRMLANDPEEAAQLAEEFAAEHSLLEFFDEIAIPALARAQADSDRGALPPDRRRIVTESFKTLLEDLSDASDDGTVSADEASPMPEIEARPPIACVAGRNELDETAALCLAHFLKLQLSTVEVEALSADVLGSDNLYFSPLRNAGIVCLSLISTSSPARARYLVRRIRRRAPRARVIVGFWGSLNADHPTAETATATTADAVVSSLPDAMLEIAAQAGSDRRAVRAS